MFCSLANSFNHPLRTIIKTNMVIIQWSLFSVSESSAVGHYGPDGFPIIATIDTLLLQHSSLHKEYTRKKTKRQKGKKTKRRKQGTQSTKGPLDRGTNGPRDQGTNGPMDQWTKGPWDQGTNRPKDHGTKGPRDQGTKGP